MYADTVTGSMRRAITETNRRRKLQMEYNRVHGITPKTVVKGIRDVIELGTDSKEDKKRGKRSADEAPKRMTAAERDKLIAKLTVEMREASAHLEFEQAAFLRARIKALRTQKTK